MSLERRNDIAAKISYVILTFLIGLVLTIFFTKTYDIALCATEGMNKHETRITVLEKSVGNIECTLEKIDKKLDRALDANHGSKP